MSSQSLPTSFHMSVMRTCAWVRDISGSGRNDWHWGGRAATELWVWQEVWTLSPAPDNRLYTPFSEKAGCEGEHLTTKSGVLPPTGA